MSDPDEILRERLAALSVAYGRRLGERLRDLEAAWVRALADPQARDEFRRLAHQLKGSGRTFGFPAVSETAALLEAAVRQLPPDAEVDDDQRAAVEERMDALRVAVAASAES